MSISTPRRARLYEQGGNPTDQMLGVLQFGIFRIQDQMHDVMEEFTPERVTFLYRDFNHWLYAGQQLCFYLHVAHSATYPPDEIAELVEHLDHLEERVESFYDRAFGAFGIKEFFLLSNEWIQTRNLTQELLDQLED